MAERGRYGKTVTTGDILPEILKKIEKKAGGKLAVLSATWGELVGEDVSRHTEPCYLRGRRLSVEVDDSIWMSELSRFHKRTMIEAINKGLEEDILDNIVFRLKKG